MVLFGFGSKKEEKKVGKGEIPVEKTKNLLNRGFSEIEIIDMLRKEGYSAEEIDKALMQAISEIKPIAPTTQPQVLQTSQAQPLTQQTLQIPSQTPQKIIEASSQTLSQVVQTPHQISQAMSLPSQIAPQEKPQKEEIVKEKTEQEMLPSIDYVSLEEYLDYLIKEKISEFNKRLIEINLKFKDVEEKFISLKEELENLKKGSKEDFSKILNEIRLNRDSINDLSLQVETLGKTLKELLPSLIESVRLLGEIVQKMKT